MNIFDKIARQYDTDKIIKLTDIIAKEIKNELRDTKYEIGVDYGCGTGLVGLQLIDQFKTMMFIDSSKEMINIVDEKIKNLNIKNAKTFYGNFAQSNNIKIKADVIILSLVLLHIPDTVQILNSLYDLLKEDGRLIIVDFDKNENINHEKVHNGFLHKELDDILKNIGYEEINIKTFYHGKKIFMNQDALLFILNALK